MGADGPVPPRMHRTRVHDLVAPLVLAGVVVYAFLRFDYDSVPTLGYYVAVPVVALAAVELALARRVRGVVAHRLGRRPMTAISIARCVALGKASSLVAAALLGAAAALLGRVLPHAGAVAAAAHDARVGAVIAGACVALGAAGLTLEAAGLDPGRRDEHG